MIIKNFFLQVFSRGDRNPKLSPGGAAPENHYDATQARIEQSEALIAERVDEAQKEHFEKALVAVQAMFAYMDEAMSADGEIVNEAEMKTIEKLLTEMIDSHLEARAGAMMPDPAEDELAISRRILRADEYEGRTLAEVAAAHGFASEDEFIDWNIAQGNTMRLRGRRGSRRFHPTDAVLVPQTAEDAAQRRADLEDMQRGLVGESRIRSVEDVIRERHAELRERAQAQLAELAIQRETLYREFMNGDYEGRLRGKKADLPEFLQGNKRHTSHETWAELFRRADHENNPNAKRLAEIIDDEPLGWRPSQFRAAIRKGGNKVLSFKNITKFKLGENQNQFFRRYRDGDTKLRSPRMKRRLANAEGKILAQLRVVEGITREYLDAADELTPDLQQKPNETLGAYIKRIEKTKASEFTNGSAQKQELISILRKLNRAERKLYKLQTAPVILRKEQLEEELEMREQLMIQAWQVLKALNTLREGETLHQHAFRRYETQVQEERVTGKAPNIYDIDDLALYSEVVVTETNEELGTVEGEGLGITTEIIAAVRGRFRAAGAGYTEKMDAGFVLRLMAFSYGIENLVKMGSIVKDTETGALYLAHIPEGMGDADFANIAQSLSVDEETGILNFDVEEARTFQLKEFSRLLNGTNDPEKQEMYREAYARALAERGFQNEGDIISMEAIAAGESLIYKRTARHLMATVGDSESALADLIQYRTVEGDLQEEELLGDIDYFIDAGIDGIFQDVELTGSGKGFHKGIRLDVVSLLDSLEIPVEDLNHNGKNDRAEIRKIDRKINRLANAMSRKQRRIDNTKERLEKQIRSGLIYPGGPRAAAMEQRIARLETEIEDLRGKKTPLESKRMDILAPYIEKVREIMQLPDDITSVSDLTPHQRIFLTNGYAIMEGRRMTDRVSETQEEFMEQIEAVLEKYRNDPEVYPHLVSIVESFRDPTSGLIIDTATEDILTPETLELCATAIHEGINAAEEELRRGVTLRPVEIIDEATGETKTVFGIGAGLQTTEQRYVSGGRVGLYVPIDLPIDGLSIAIGIYAGNTEQGGVEGGAGGSISYTLSPDPIFHLTTSLQVGGGFKGPDAYIGATFSETATLELGLWDVSAGGSFGVGLTLKDGPTLLGAVHASVGVNVDRLRERRIDKFQFQTNTDIIDADIPLSEKVAIIAEMPGFEEFAKQLAAEPGITPRTREAILWDMFVDHAEHVGNIALADWRPPLFTGAGIAYGFMPPFIIPFISIAVAGRTKLFFTVPGNPNQLYTETNERLQDKIAEQIAKLGLEGEPTMVTDPRIIDRADIMAREMPPGDFEDRPYSIGRQRYQLNIGEHLASDLERMDTATRRNGISLTPGEGEAEGLIHMTFLDEVLQGDVEIRFDPDMDAKIIVGDRKPPTSQDLYIAMNRMQLGSAIEFDVQPVITRHKDGGVYVHTRITIRSLDPAQAERAEREEPQRNYFQDYEDLGAGSIFFRRYSSLDIDDPRSPDALGDDYDFDRDPLLTWEQFTDPAYQETLRSRGLTGLSVKKWEEQVDRMSDVLFDNPNPLIRANDLEPHILRFFRNNSALCKMSTLFDDDMVDELEALEEKVREYMATQDFDPPVSDVEVDYIMSVIRKNTYVSHSHEFNDKERAHYREKYRKYFLKVLSAEYSPEIARQMLLDIEQSAAKKPPTLPMEIPTTAEMYTVVGSEGANGLRADTMQDVALINPVSYNVTPDEPADPARRQEVLEVRTAALARLRDMPVDNPREFMRTSIARNTLEMYYFLRSPDKAEKMLAIYEDPSLITSQPDTYGPVFAEFQETVMLLRETELTGRDTVITTDYGLDIVIGIQSEIWGGSLGYCDNPTLYINQKVSIRLPQTTTISEMEAAIQEMPGRIRRDIYQFFAAGSWEDVDEDYTPEPEDEPEVPPDDENDLPEGGKDADGTPTIHDNQNVLSDDLRSDSWFADDNDAQGATGSSNPNAGSESTDGGTSNTGGNPGRPGQWRPGDGPLGGGRRPGSGGPRGGKE